MEHAQNTGSKTLVIYCAGTGNEISENISNVLKLYRCLRKNATTHPRQMVLSDPRRRHGDATRKQHGARVNHALTNAA